MNLAVIILAAGEGTRMKSKKPKVLHEILGQPMIAYVVDAARTLEPERIVVVVGHGSELVRQRINGGVRIAIQEEQLGTGHAVMQAIPELEGFEGQVMIICGDTPLITGRTLTGLVSSREKSGAAVSLLTAKPTDRTGYGRIVRDGNRVLKIVEEKDASPEERLIDEINAGTYCFKKDALLFALGRISVENAQKEYYLTDAVEILALQGEKIVACTVEEPAEGLGVNSRSQLARAARILRRRINECHMFSGVTIVEPDLTFISSTVRIGRDTTIHPNCYIEGETVIGEECEIGPNVRIVDCSIGDEVQVEQAVLKSATIEDRAVLGPFCHVRPGTRIGRGAKIGGFVEVKQSEIEEEAKVPHLSYVGDAKIGKGANLGAGTITCNFDGFEKHETVVEEDAFVGSDTMLVAPVRIGKGAFTGAGSVITKDVPADSLGLERSEQKNSIGWAKKRRESRGKKSVERRSKR
ncbi:MAG: bifunctional UDP-N-acetylglucosamine diphosphorylase/glucosamine-1-phosphate N-acetyltransferase GlmU [Actinobacteria bacterium]|nr:bifunctional UDP-N-acetylglucosamine diphosphorylase/glucosamine-1-phosphate N-acetyltransferase GlmU [Actinomycetota bacterium]